MANNATISLSTITNIQSDINNVYEKLSDITYVSRYTDSNGPQPDKPWDIGSLKFYCNKYVVSMAKDDTSVEIPKTAINLPSNTAARRSIAMTAIEVKDLDFKNKSTYSVVLLPPSAINSDTKAGYVVRSATGQAVTLNVSITYIEFPG